MKTETKSNTKVLGYATVAAILGVGFAAAMSASAYGGMGMRGNVDPEDRVAIAEALEEGDYDTWVTLISEEHPRLGDLSEERFTTMAEHFADRQEHHEAVEEALEEGDYDEWKELMGDRGRITEAVTEENFNTFVEMHESMEEGDTDKAQELREELGLGQRPGDGSGYRNGGADGKGEGVGRRAGNMHRGLGSGDGINNRWGN